MFSFPKRIRARLFEYRYEPLSEKTTTERAPDGDTKWIDGVRGIAAIFVMFNHVSLSLYPQIISPPSPDVILDSPFRWPFVHALFTGAPWVQLFLFISGCVNALKPLKLSCQGQHEAAVLSLSSNTFRRALRLMAPITVSTVLSWILTQVGVYQIANISRNNWLNYTSPRPSATFGAMFYDLFYAFYQTWTEATNYYDKNLWCMVYFLQGSMMLYFYLLATAKMRPGFRILLTTFMLVYSWRKMDAMVGVPTFSGILFAEIVSKARFLEIAASRSMIKRVGAFGLFVFGAYLLSFPSTSWQWYPHFKFIWNDLFFIFPPGANIFFDTLNFAIILVMAGLALSPTFQWLLRHRLLLWLGEASLPIYLLHGPLLRSVFMWIAYAGIYPEYKDAQLATGETTRVLQPIEDPSSTRIAVALPIWFCLTLLLARLWTKTVEVWCASAVKGLEDIAVGKKELLLRFRVGIAESESQEAGWAS